MIRCLNARRIQKYLDPVSITPQRAPQVPANKPKAAEAGESLKNGPRRPRNVVLGHLTGILVFPQQACQAVFTDCQRPRSGLRTKKHCRFSYVLLFRAVDQSHGPVPQLSEMIR